MNILKSSSIKKKKDLYAYYLDHMTRDAIGSEIKTACKGRENVPKKTRSKSGSVYYGSILSLKEVVIFIANNDAPAGYVLDEEMQRRVDEYKRVYVLKK